MRACQWDKSVESSLLEYLFPLKKLFKKNHVFLIMFSYSDIAAHEMEN